MDNYCDIQAFPKELSAYVWPHLDFVTATHVRETSKANELLIAKFFPEMLAWQTRCLDLMVMKQQAAISTQVLFQQNGVIAFIMHPECKKLLHLASEIQKMQKIIEHHRLFLQLGESHPLSLLLGGTEAIFKMPEISLTNLSSQGLKDLPQLVMKGIDVSTGDFFICIRDQFESFYTIQYAGILENARYTIPLKNGNSMIKNLNSTKRFNDSEAALPILGSALSSTANMLFSAISLGVTYIKAVNATTPQEKLQLRNSGMVQILNNLGNKERARPYPHLDWFVN